MTCIIRLLSLSLSLSLPGYSFRRIHLISRISVTFSGDTGKGTFREEREKTRRFRREKERLRFQAIDASEAHAIQNMLCDFLFPFSFSARVNFSLARRVRFEFSTRR